MNAYDFYLKKFTKSVSQPPSGEDVRMNIGSNELPCKPISFSTSCNQDRAAVNKLMIFCTDPSLGNFDYAEKVFRFIRDPCLFVYDVMIRRLPKGVVSEAPLSSSGG
ncbi:pentatricopeptide repeat-containing protein [Pyrus ussuriensis x Pyrus communis]|uniref:Pentatricopeptide repeat-containing protein n=1 Tax=Pyrus ussuriensis x Pyrus communis TaxID=2448454 RepID=A0A5N5H5B5_9ROSA|nr:pentatricopeptide repeat-containing protein [Pyrus ussuriensis x Pyrus communis]